MMNKIEEQDFWSMHGEMVQVWGLQVEIALVVHAKIFISEIVEKEQHCISDSPKALNVFPCYMKDVGSESLSIVMIASYVSHAKASNHYALWPVRKVYFSTYVIKRSFSLTSIFNDMKGIYKKLFKSKKPSLGSVHGPGPATSTSTLITNTTDLRLKPSIPASDSDATASAEVAAGVSVSVQLRPSHLLSIDLLLSSRPLIISESLPRFPLWRPVILLL